ncbi:kanamycin nucleotidyltransferase C-terminal domain-containing protein [Geomicrobium sp. JCM 19039]|uniref:kanamycin nucleotidyltransferase C-terminal domain-containing protein n=1 Tax=Geomicrobium sp. JCM 19039 TaxID=1460636 RepID=UPI00045F1992|nr:kanamycin nucleotidyltransferase C-terminal domain-containing protein [Geomicrobium sp. JCM 19039]GAK13302.1 kanamycin nucleotidyltransferase [Geomicrobium sp. JCM 19039]
MREHPLPTSIQEKEQFYASVAKQLLSEFAGEIVAIGLYGSMATGSVSRYSDIEMHVIITDNCTLKEHEFVYPPFKLELSVATEQQFLEGATKVDDSWAIRTGIYMNILPLHDPSELFKRARELPLLIDEQDIRATMRIFMIWEPYETMGKIRGNMEMENFRYLPMGAYDLVWQTAKLIGLWNRIWYSTRAKTFQEALAADSIPAGFEPLASRVLTGKLEDTKAVYACCEALWEGLNIWYEQLGIPYMEREMPQFK